jgi:hypothetical protein
MTIGVERLEPGIAPFEDAALGTLYAPPISQIHRANAYSEMRF